MPFKCPNCHETFENCKLLDDHFRKSQQCVEFAGVLLISKNLEDYLKSQTTNYEVDNEA